MNYYVNFSQQPLIQQKKFSFRQETLAYQQTVRLHSTIHGNSKSIISIQIPPRTVCWYYTFTTYKAGLSILDNLELGLQVAKLLPLSGDIKIGIAATQEIINRIRVPDGSKEINSFVFEYQYGSIFMNSDRAIYKIGTELLNTKSGKKEIKRPMPGIYYIGLQNLNSVSPVDIKIEAVAIVAYPEK